MLDGRHDIVSVQAGDRVGSGTGSGTVRHRHLLPVTGHRIGTEATGSGWPWWTCWRPGRWWTAPGTRCRVTTTRGEERRVLVLDATDAGYRISAIEPG